MTLLPKPQPGLKRLNKKEVSIAISGQAISPKHATHSNSLHGISGVQPFASLWAGDSVSVLHKGESVISKPKSQQRIQETNPKNPSPLKPNMTWNIWHYGGPQMFPKRCALTWQLAARTTQPLTCCSSPQQWDGEENGQKLVG